LCTPAAGRMSQAHCAVCPQPQEVVAVAQPQMPPPCFQLRVCRVALVCGSVTMRRCAKAMVDN
jgi:hypothetical protein